jgi:cellulose synthase/poly-beta-1,6-N-acetylglucosamine synthase-like glycosyltransferase
MVSWFFWAALGIGLYPYLGYPLAVHLLSFIARRDVRRDDRYTSSVTVVIAAYNEAECIAATVRNKLSQEYPHGLLDVIVVSDGSTDGTDEVVERIAREDQRVRLFQQTPRQGKTAALNYAAQAARGDILVFSDANSMYRHDAVRKLVRNFADPDVGYVSGRMVYVDPTGSLVGDGCTAFMRYENALRKAETNLGSVVGVDGGIDAVRRSLYTPMRHDQLPDFVLPLSVVEKGCRVVFEPEAILNEETLTQERSEYRMRVRVALRAFWALLDKRALLNPFAFGWFAWQVLSHKVLRYLSFLPLSLAAIANWMVIDQSRVYFLGVVCQIAFLGVILAVYLAPRALDRVPLVRYCAYFALLNVASAVAFTRFVLGQKQAVWQPRVG